MTAPGIHTPTQRSGKSLSTRSKVLVIEDDADTRDGLRLRLTASNYDVVLTQEGDNAVALAQKVKPDLILLDLGLPGIDGLSVLRKLKLTQVSAPVIVLTAWDEAAFEEAALAAGARAYLQKPVPDSELLDAIEFLLS